MKFNSLVYQSSARAALMAFAALGWSCTGCAPAGPARQAVQGTVTFEGKPVSGLTLVFTPVGSEQMGAAVEVVEGQFDLPANVGPSVGRHHVTLNMQQPDLEEFEALRQAGQQPFAKLNVPLKYSRPGALEAEVKANESNVFNFQLQQR